MTVAEAAHRPAHRGRAVKLWLGFLLIIAIGIGLAWLGTESVKSRVVQVRTVQAGEGAFIQPEDGVLIEYEGRLEDGKVFESTEGKGPVPLIAGQTVPGFTQALMRMQRGGRYRIHIPSDLAYGANPPEGAPIPPNADLEFDIHVVQIVPNAAAMMQGQPQQ